MYRHMNSYDHFIYEFICILIHMYEFMYVHIYIWITCSTCNPLFHMIISYMNSYDS